MDDATGPLQSRQVLDDDADPALAVSQGPGDVCRG